MRTEGRKTGTGSGAAAALRGVFRKWDALIIAVVIAAAALSVWFAFRSDGGEARVFVDGELRYTFPLSADGEYDILDGRMTIGVRGGEVYVVRSDCSEQLCVHSAPQSSEGSMIVCLPNRVVVVIGDREVDAVT